LTDSGIKTKSVNPSMFLLLNASLSVLCVSVVNSFFYASAVNFFPQFLQDFPRQNALVRPVAPGIAADNLYYCVSLLSLYDGKLLHV
jgi:hypothetical protein